MVKGLESAIVPCGEFMFEKELIVEDFVKQFEVLAGSQV